jgi:small subunit ribosomal protein S16
MQGVRNHKFFHLVAIDGRKRRDAAPLELLGVYRPRTDGAHPTKTVQWSVDRIRFWLRNGAEPSRSAVRLLTLVRASRVAYGCAGHPLTMCWRAGQAHPARLAVPPEGTPSVATTRRPACAFQRRRNTAHPPAITAAAPFEAATQGLCGSRRVGTNDRVCVGGSQFLGEDTRGRTQCVYGEPGGGIASNIACTRSPRSMLCCCQLVNTSTSQGEREPSIGGLTCIHILRNPHVNNASTSVFPAMRAISTAVRSSAS